MFAAVGYGKLMARTVLIRFVKAEDLDEIEQARTSKLRKVADVVRRALRLGDDRILIKGVDDVLVYRAKCCNPIRGEEIIGYITRGKGVGVHSKNCPNVQNLLYDADRKIEVEWGAGTTQSSEAYAVPLTIVTEDRPGMLAEIAAVVADVGSNIVNAEARTSDERGTIDLVVEIPDMKHL